MTVDRVPRLQQAMAEADVHVAVIAASSNLRYLQGYRGMAVDRLTCLLVSQREAVMVLPHFDADEYVETTANERIEVWHDADGPAAAIESAFGQLGALPDDPVAVVDEELPFRFFTEIRSSLGALPPGRAGTLLDPLRVVKEEAEQQLMARAAELVSLGVDAALDAARPGVAEIELQRLVEQTLFDGGAESADYVLVQAGPASAVAHHTPGRARLEAGAPLLVDVSGRFEGYFADITQQVFLGEPSAEYLDAYAAVVAAQEAGFRAATPGATVGEVDRVAQAVLADAGYAEASGPRTGHGIGLEVHEPPSVIRGNDFVLEPGVVITVEPGIYFPDRFGIRIEDTVLVTGEGPVRLTRGARPLTVHEASK